MEMIRKVNVSTRKVALGFALLTLVGAPLFMWFSVLFALNFFEYMDAGNLEQMFMSALGAVGFLGLSVGSIYFFIPPLAEVESIEIRGDEIFIERVALHPLVFKKRVSFATKRILIPNYTEDKNKKNFEAYLYVSWPIFFVLSERLEGYEELNTILQGKVG